MCPGLAHYAGHAGIRARVMNSTRVKVKSWLTARQTDSHLRGSRKSKGRDACARLREAFVMAL
jgi:hypothetical protein